MTDSRSLAHALTATEDARIMMRWWWFGPAMSCAEATRQLTLMRDAGIGGVEVAYVYPVSLEGEVAGATILPFLSPAFCDVLRFAADEAHRLGLRFDLTLGSGWPFGGPHVSPRSGARQLATRPIDIPAHAVDVPLPRLHDGEAALLAVGDDGRALPVVNGRIRLAAGAASATTATLLVATPTGQSVKRAARGAEGVVLDHYDEAALQAHLDAVGRVLLDAAGPGRVRAIFTDSLEVYGSNWTHAFLAEFAQRRGYDLAEFLPLLVDALRRGESAPTPNDGDAHRERLVRDVQHDYAQTLTELLHDRFLRPLHRFARERGVLSRVQAYGVPPATMASYRHVDLPEGETTLGVSDIHQPADWTEITPNRIAASASRSKPHNLVSGETWTRLHSPPYAATPLDMKAEADQFFLQGVNQLMGHGWCHRPAGGDPTQWVFYAAANFNEANPWHPVLPDLARYLQTVSSLLRAGAPVVDVAIYLPDHDVWSTCTLSASKTNLHHVDALREHIGVALPAELLRLGFNFDLVDDLVVQTMADGDAAATPYRLVVLPRVERIPLATLDALRRLAERGVRVVALGSVPDQPIGHAARAQEADAIRRLSHALFAPGATPNIHHLPDGAAADVRAWCVPDVELDQDAPAVGYVHRRVGTHDLYFFANTRNRTVTITPRFREARRHAYHLNPLTRTATATAAERLTLAAFESAVVLRSDRPVDAEAFGDFELRDVAAPAPSTQRPIDDGWTLTFPDGRRLACDRLRPWTEWEALRSYSGEGTYSRRIDVPPAWLTRRVDLNFDEAAPVSPHRRDPARRNTGFSVFLDAPIKDAAEVLLNGQRIASLFAPPYHVELTGLLASGENLLEVKVYNRLVNALAHRTPYDFAPIHEAYGQRFDKIQDLDTVSAEPSGLTGSASLRIYD